jgi:tetratricopeptide (TPR) repeat protein
MRRANVAIFSMYAGDFAVAENESESTIQLNPDYPKAFIVRGLSQLAQGKVKEATDSYRHVESALSPSLASIALADLALYQGRLADAIAILEPAIARSRQDQKSATTAKQLVLLAQAYLAGGHKPEAMKAAADAVTEDTSGDIAIEAGRIFAQAGNEAKARAVAAPLATKLNRDYQAYAKIIAGEILLEHGDSMAAVQQFRDAQTLADTWLGRFDLGLAYLAAGAFAQAHAEFNTCQSRRGEATALFLDEMPTYHYYPATLYYLGRVQQELKSPAAAESFRAFLALKAPDSSEPMVVDARRRGGAL